MKRRTATRAVMATVNLIFLTVGWLFLAPPQLGGVTRYAIIEGSSMAPLLSDGDLAVVRSTGEVAVGGSGSFTDDSQPHLVLGSPGIDAIRGAAGDDCILGGGGIDALRGDAGNDVCIGGPGVDVFFASCETRIQ